MPRSSSHTNDFMIQMDQITKRFQQNLVLDRISLTIPSQQALALVGENGSGKSTLLRIIAGILPASSGTIRYGTGHAPEIGFVPDRLAGLSFSAKEYLMHMGLIHGIDKTELNKRIAYYLELVRLQHAGKTRMRDFSKGMLQKVGIIQALLGKPGLLILDEPLSGLDEESERDVLTLFGQLKQEKLTIVFACHETHLLEHLADRIVRLRSSQIDSDTLARGTILSVRITAKLKKNNAVDEWNGRAGILGAASTDTGIVLTVTPEESDNVLRELLKQDAAILSLIRSEGGSV